MARPISVPKAKDVYYFTAILNNFQHGTLKQLSCTTEKPGPDHPERVREVYQLTSDTGKVYVLRCFTLFRHDSSAIKEIYDTYESTRKFPTCPVHRTKKHVAEGLRVEQTLSFDAEERDKVRIESLFEYAGEDLLAAALSDSMLISVALQAAEIAETGRTAVCPEALLFRDGILKLSDLSVGHRLVVPPAHLPPPQSEREQEFPACEVYSWGMTFYQLATRKTREQVAAVFELGRSSPESYGKLIDSAKDLRWSSVLSSLVSAGFWSLVISSLSYAPTKRPTLTEIRARLWDLLTSLPGAEPKSAVPLLSPMCQCGKARCTVKLDCGHLTCTKCASELPIKFWDAVHPPGEFRLVLCPSCRSPQKVVAVDLSCGCKSADGVVEASYDSKQGRIVGPACKAHGKSISQDEALAIWSEVTLELFWTYIGPAQVRKAVSAIRVDRMVTSLGLDRNVIGDSGVRLLAEAIKANGAVRKLSLRMNNINAAGAKTLSDFLKESRTLTSLDIGANSLGEAGAKAIAETFKPNKTLTALILRENGLAAAGARWVALGLRDNSSLRALDLGYNDIGEVGAQSISEMLAHNKTLQILGLEGNELGKQGAKHVSEGLQLNAGLLVLDLSENSVGEEGAGHIALALRTNSVLRVLDLEENQIRPAGTRMIAQALTANCALTTLSLAGNKAGMEGAKWLAEALRVNKTLTTVNAWYDLDEQDWPLQIELALKRNRGLAACGRGGAG